MVRAGAGARPGAPWGQAAALWVHASLQAACVSCELTMVVVAGRAVGQQWLPGTVHPPLQPMLVFARHEDPAFRSAALADTAGGGDASAAAAAIISYIMMVD